MEWFSQSLAGSNDFPITSTPDLLLVRYAPTIPICAVIINQLSVRNECVMFVSPRHNQLYSSSLNCLRNSPASGRRWVIGYIIIYVIIIYYIALLLYNCFCSQVISMPRNFIKYTNFSSNHFKISSVKR